MNFKNTINTRIVVCIMYINSVKDLMELLPFQYSLYIVLCIHDTDTPK